MSTSFRLLGVIGVVCIAALGLMYAFGFITQEFLAQNSMQIGMGLGVLALAIVALKVLSGGRNSTSDTEPPPTL